MKYVIFFACLFFCFVSFGQEQEQMITVKKGL